MEESLKALMHPLRWRIIQQLAGGPSTAGELNTKLTDVAPATLYRHLQALLTADLIAVTDEKPIRGAVEKTYALAGLLDDSDPSPESRRNQAALVLGLLQADILAYLKTPLDPDPAGLTLTRTEIYATPQELDELNKVLTEALTPLLHPHEGATPHHLGLIMTPETTTGQDDS